MEESWMFGDLHIHSRFSRACSKNIDFENLVKWARVKGLHLLGTGDFTHPIWMNEIKEKLKDRGKGFYYYENFPFVITGEISLIYTQERGRKVHLVILVPSIEIAEKINSYLDSKGRRDYDGRPIFKISCEQFVKDMREISCDIEVIPAHIYTPYFGVFGSMSGFDSLKEAFGTQVEYIHAIETGMSSNPEMNWKISELSKISIVSFSDSHSFWPFRIGREATIFKKCDSYSEILRQIRENDFIGTIEVNPSYGKYHFDGHADCCFSCDCNETKKLNGICPKCGRKLTLGVDYRVEQLKNNPDGFKPLNSKVSFEILPLQEIISLCFGMGMNSKKVWSVYDNLISLFGNEFKILLDVSKEEFIEKNIDEKLIGLILKNRIGNINVQPGYDGVYGKALLEEKQSTLN